MAEIQIGGVYRHYKNQLYKVHGLVRHSETEEELVLYECLYPCELGQFWVRPKAMFTETVSVGNFTGPRFQLVNK